MIAMVNDCAVKIVISVLIVESMAYLNSNIQSKQKWSQLYMKLIGVKLMMVSNMNNVFVSCAINI